MRCIPKVWDTGHNLAYIYAMTFCLLLFNTQSIDGGHFWTFFVEVRLLLVARTSQRNSYGSSDKRIKNEARDPNEHAQVRNSYSTYSYQTRIKRDYAVMKIRTLRARVCISSCPKCMHNEPLWDVKICATMALFRPGKHHAPCVDL